MSETSNKNYTALIGSAEENFFKALNTPQLNPCSFTHSNANSKHKKQSRTNTSEVGAFLNERQQSEATFRLRNHCNNSQIKDKGNQRNSLMTKKSEEISQELLFSHFKQNKIKNSKISNFILANMNNTNVSDNSKSSSIGVYWDPKIVAQVWSKLRDITRKVKDKKRVEQNIIEQAIINNDDTYVLEKLHNSEFKRFFRNKDDLFPQDCFLELIIERSKFNLLEQILLDSAYVFNNDYIFKFFYLILLDIEDQSDICISQLASRVNSRSVNSKKLSYKHRSEVSIGIGASGQVSQKEIVHNIIKLGLYDKKNWKKVKIIGWLLAAFECYDTFLLLLKENRGTYDNEIIQFNNFNTNEDIGIYGRDDGQFQKTLEYCLRCNFEDLAIALSEWNDLQNKAGNVPNIAAETNNMIFLKYLWEKNYNENASSLSLKKRAFREGKKRHYSNKINLFKSDDVFQPNFAINPIIKIITTKENHSSTITSVNEALHKSSLNSILQWNNIEKDKAFVEALFQYKCFEQISTLISKFDIEQFCRITYFKQVIENYQSELILFYLKRRECRHLLLDHTIQELIVKEYMSFGDRMYYGAEMLVYIYKNQWNGNLTKELCKNIMKAIKTKDILNCHSSILTCLLLIEFMEQVKEIAISNVSRCEKVISELKEYCKNIQESNPQESYISYLMQQKDTRERTAFQICSENSIYSLLETPEIGTIVKKMWDGTLSNNGFFAASSLHRFLFDSNKNSHDPYYSFDTLDSNKVYFIQLHVWLDSCSLRFNPVGLSTIALAAIYNIFIYILTLEGSLMNTYDEMNSTLRMLLMLYLLWVTFLIFDIFNQMIFCYKSHRPFQLEIMHYLDIILFIFAWLIQLDTRAIFKEYQYGEMTKMIHNTLWTLELPFTKELSTEISYYTSHMAFIIRTFILGINDLLVWIRVTGVLLTYKQMGPVMRMIFSMAMLLIRYIVIIALFLACCAGIFTAIFNRFSPQFVDFSTSIISLFGGFLNNFDLMGFEEAYVGFGSVMFITYVCIAGVLLVNLLIAVLSNVYEQLAKVVDASHRAVLITYYRKYRWDKNYGYLLFLTPPLTILNIPIMILNVIMSCCCSQKTFNIMITRIYFLLFYFPFVIVGFIVYTIIIYPFCYIKGCLTMFSYQNSIKILTIFKVLNCCKWFFGGLFYLLFVQLRDVVFCFIHIFNTIEAKGDEFSRVRKNMSNQDVIIFLKFIHSKIAPENKKDIHSLFMAYLGFEAMEKAEINESTKKAQAYMTKIDKQLTSKGKSQVETKKVILYGNNGVSNKEGNNNNSSNENASTIYTAYIRKNLMIIEILENFVIDDDIGGTYVDVDKMRKLLPMTMTIHNSHLRRLIHSDIHALSQAMTKLKASKLSFMQYQLMNKIMSSAQRLDKNIDVEILKIQRFNGDHTENIVKNKSNASNIEENEQMKKIRIHKEEMEQMKRYEALIRSIQSNVGEIINNKKQSLQNDGDKNDSIAESLISLVKSSHHLSVIKKDKNDLQYINPE